MLSVILNSYNFSVLSTIGQIVVDGRVYPSQATSPALSLPPQNSPSPGHSSVATQQQPSPVGGPVQQSPGYQQQGPRILPSYGQLFQHQNMNASSNVQPIGNYLLIKNYAKFFEHFP